MPTKLKIADERIKIMEAQEAFDRIKIDAGNAEIYRLQNLIIKSEAKYQKLKKKCGNQ